MRCLTKLGKFQVRLMTNRHASVDRVATNLIKEFLVRAAVVNIHACELFIADMQSADCI